jgi:hypothetical protein
VRDSGLQDRRFLMPVTAVYWALPSKAGNSRRSQISKLQSEIQLKTAAIGELEKRKRESESLRGDSGRTTKIVEHTALTSNTKRLKEEISQFSMCDPEAFAKLQQDAKVAKAAANRWTDNVYLLQVVCSLLVSQRVHCNICLFSRMLNPKDFQLTRLIKNLYASHTQIYLDTNPKT